MNKCIFLTQDIHADGKKYLEQRSFSLKLSKSIEKKEIINGIQGCKAAIVRLGKFDREVLEQATSLKFIARHGTGLDNIDLNACKDLGITVANDPISNVNTVAEHAIAMILNMAKNLSAIQSIFCNKGFNIREDFKSIELKDKILGIIGVGKIGSLIAHKAYFGFGMNILCFDPYCSNKDELVFCTFVKKVEELLNVSDFVSIHTPSTPDTRNFFNKERFEQMKQGAYFVNVARGDLVVEQDLIAALKSGKLAGAALDVFAQEPIPLEHDFFKMPNIVITPHNAALSLDALKAMGINAAMRINEFFNNKQILYRVV